ncbi:MAG: NifU N-terminal domain-containing protein [Acidimicrobiia bacterium]|nr:NifU N-terminal domain-containing protein [Acidimicrobiia bacterium]
MPVIIDATPNPNALKFTVGVDVGGPQTFVAGKTNDNELATSLLEIAGVTSIFMTADFVTLTKSGDADWNEIAPQAQAILGSHFD